MATAGPNYPGTGASLANAGTSENANAWANPGNVGSSSAVASITAATFDSPDISEILVASNFGFNISGTITGITVEISKRGYTSTNSGKDFRVQLSTSTAFSGLVGDNKASANVWPQTTLTTTTYGSSSDTWNASLTDTQVNSSGFAVFLSAYANVANADIDVDWIRVTIQYTASVSGSAADSVSTSESLDRAGSFARALTDTTTTSSSSAAATKAASRTIADTPSMSDAAVRAVAAPRTATDSLSTADASVEALSSPRTLTDAVSASDSVAGEKGTVPVERSFSDTLFGAGGAFQSDAFQGDAFQSGSAEIDSATRVVSAPRSASDTLTVADAATQLSVTSRTATDSLSVSDSATETASHPRTASDSVTTSDAVAGGRLAARSASDTATISDSVTRIVAAPRTASDSPATSDSSARVLAATRTASDSLTLADEAVAAGRTIADSVTTSDSVSRVAVLGRTASDSVTASEAVEVSSGNEVNVTAADSVTTSDTAAQVRNLARSAADAVTTSDATASVRTVHRTLADTASTSDATARALALGRTASDGTYLSDAALFYLLTEVPGYEGILEPSIPVQPANVHIYVAGVEITQDVLFSTARFVSKVNGKPGEASMRVRDDDSTYSFTQGSDWLVTINGQAAWRGYVTSVIRTYIAPAENVGISGLQRVIDLRGVDLNILFTRRVVYRKSSPANVEGTQFPAGTADTTAITELLANWLDLSSDGLDTTSGVRHVGDLDPTQATRAWSGSWTWGQAMDTIAALPAAIYYIRPEIGAIRGTLVYCDADTATNPLRLTDQPYPQAIPPDPEAPTTPPAPIGFLGVPGDESVWLSWHAVPEVDYAAPAIGSIGYREMEIILDGTGLANDVLEWGMGYGSQTPVFKRLTDTASVAAHGRWQQADRRSGVYKQATIDRVADAIVYGSPDNHRGAKDDRPAVSLTTYMPGLLAGQVVPFESNVWNWSDIMPVRQMEVTFEAPQYPKYTALLSHEIDAPWGFIDQFWPKIPTYVGPCPNPPCYQPPPPPLCPDGSAPPCAGGCTDAICGITDTFTREVASGWGTSDAGIDYTPSSYGSFAQSSVTGGVGELTLVAGTSPSTSTWRAEQDLFASGGSFPVDMTFTVSFNAAAKGDPNTYAMCWVYVDNSNTMNLRFEPGSGYYYISVGSGSDSSHVSISFTNPLRVRYRVEGSGSTATGYVKTWAVGAAEPADWALTHSGSFSGSFGYGQFSIHQYRTIGTSGYTVTMYIDDLDIVGVNRCEEYRFDNFNRSIDPSWGTSDSGFTWYTTGDAWVNGSSGVLLPADSGSVPSQSSASLTEAGPWDGDFEAVFKFLFLSVPAGSPESYYSITAADSGGAYSTSIGINPSSVSGTVVIWSGVGTPVAGTNAESMSRNFTANTWYFLRWQHHRPGEGTDRLRFWAATDTEPGTWDLEISTHFSGSLSGPQFVLTDMALAAHRSQRWYFDYIDLDYAGSPCYQDCSAVVEFDNFDRTVASGWGTSDFGVAWVENYTPNPAGAAYVDSGLGMIDISAFTYSPYFRSLRTAVMSPSPVADSFTMTSDFSYGTSLTGSESILFGFMAYSDASAEIHMSPDEALAHLSISSGSQYDVAIPVAPAAGTIIHARWVVDKVAATSTISVWWNGVAEVSASGPVSVSANTQFQVSVDGDDGDTPWTGTVSYDFIHFGSCSDVMPGEAGGVAASPSGYGCVEATRSSSTLYTVPSTFVPKSTFVWRDGLLLRRGTDYTENSNRLGITLDTAAGTSTVITICYFAG